MLLKEFWEGLKKETQQTLRQIEATEKDILKEDVSK